jgi:hypothetical protein
MNFPLLWMEGGREGGGEWKGVETQHLPEAEGASTKNQ